MQNREIEIEKTFLAKYIPEDIKKHESKKIIDIYIPKGAEHAKLRIRKQGDLYEITKKTAFGNKDHSTHLEENIKLNQKEFEAFSKISGNKIIKTRYYYPYKQYIAEIDIFSDKLSGLVLVDFEFKNKRELNNFNKPDFCLADVTNEEDIAGGVLNKYSFSSLKNFLDKFSYHKLKYEQTDN